MKHLYKKKNIRIVDKKKGENCGTRIGDTELKQVRDFKYTGYILIQKGNVTPKFESVLE